MATMKRNHNLEEISTGSMLEDFELLKGQTFKQKCIFFGGVALGIGFTLWGTFAAEIDIVVMVFVALIPIFIGVIFGCNYNEDVTLLRYIKISIFDSNQVLYSKPKEGIEYLRESAEKIKQEDMIRNQSEEDFDEHFRKTIKRLVIVICVIAVAVIVLLIVFGNSEGDEIHHTVSMVGDVKDFIG